MLIICDHPPLYIGSPLEIRMHGDCRHGQMLYYTVKGRTMFSRDEIFLPQSVFNLQRVEPVTRGQGLTTWKRQNPNKLSLKKEKDLLPTAGNLSWGRGFTEKQGPREQRKLRDLIQEAYAYSYTGWPSYNSEHAQL